MRRYFTIAFNSLNVETVKELRTEVEKVFEDFGIPIKRHDIVVWETELKTMDKSYLYTKARKELFDAVLLQDCMKVSYYTYKKTWPFDNQLYFDVFFSKDRYCTISIVYEGPDIDAEEFILWAQSREETLSRLGDWTYCYSDIMPEYKVVEFFVIGTSNEKCRTAIEDSVAYSISDSRFLIHKLPYLFTFNALKKDGEIQTFTFPQNYAKIFDDYSADPTWRQTFKTLSEEKQLAYNEDFLRWASDPAHKRKKQ